jgi:hypothetical protein
MKAGGGRIVSIDLLRGLDVLLMLFVNEVAGVTGAPAFLLHKTAADDGMTLTDTVFPAFLFIVGMAIPFALGGRLRRGESKAAVFRHVLARAFALLVVGVLMVNAEESGPGGPLSPALWNVLMTVGVAMVFQAQAPPGGSPWPGRLRLVGIVLLVLLAFAYSNPAVGGPFQMRPHWWGILGLIGWAYLVAAAVYLVAGERPLAHLAAMVLLYCLYLADFAGHAGWLAPFRLVVEVGTALGSHAAVVVAGTVLSLLLRAHRREGRSPARFATSLRLAIYFHPGGSSNHAEMPDSTQRSIGFSRLTRLRARRHMVRWCRCAFAFPGERRFHEARASRTQAFVLSAKTLSRTVLIS